MKREAERERELTLIMKVLISLLRNNVLLSARSMVQVVKHLLSSVQISVPPKNKRKFWSVKIMPFYRGLV
jgi:hypothetical protein